MPAWATVILTLGTGLITGRVAFITQRMAARETRATQVEANRYDEDKQLRSNSYDGDKQFRAEAYTEFNAFMLSVGTATDAITFAARNLPNDAATEQIGTLVDTAVEKVRQVRIHEPLITAYASNDETVRSVCRDLLQLLGDASYSLRHHTGATTTPGTPWEANEIAEKLREGADKLQTDLAVKVIEAIRRASL
jgi:hypothetical protein